MTSRPFLSRLILPFAAVIVLIISVSGAVIYQTGQRAVRLQQLSYLHQLTTRMRQMLAGDPAMLSPAHQASIRDYGYLLGTRITLIAGDGAVLLDTHADAAKMPNHNDRPEVVGARRGDDVEQIRHSDTIHADAMYVAELLDRTQPDGMVVRLSYPRDQWAALNVPVWAIVGWGALATLVSIGLLSFILNRQWIAPVRRLAAASDRIAAGEWQTHVEPAGADDLRFFSSRLNQVARNLEKHMAELRNQRADLQAVVDTLPDPILLTDAAGRILVINAPAARLLDLVPPQAVGKTLVNVLADEAILQLVEQLPAGTTGDVQRELRLVRNGARMVFQGFVTRTAAGGVLIVLRDITTLTNTVQMKTDFVANASHELRTPIAAIKAAFETLQDVVGDDPIQTTKCIQIIAGHLHRLEEMLRDLLDLSRVERPDLQPDARRVTAGELFAILRSTLGVTAKQKGVELRLLATPDNAAFLSDERLLNLVLKNLVENAVKFTPAGGSVTVTIAQTGEGVELTCQDTGIGIPPEHLDRVFERFYQVNAARTGAGGRGTGLGLAIVKHALAALGGSVKLESQVGVGTTVTCTLPPSH
jgi:two-component system phosphate regulon sensor histidine kinase PhoR